MATLRDGYPFVPYEHGELSLDESERRGVEFYEHLNKRRSVRDFSPQNVPRRLIEIALQSASTAPSGAHKQPWSFVAVQSAELKREIRIAAEEEEKRSYDERMSDEWKEALAPLGTDWRKPFLEHAPWLVVAFAQNYGVDTEGNQKKHYYVKESVGLACGLFIASLHTMGLCTLTHTPSPMGFLTELLGRPENEKPFILFPVGYPDDGAMVPEIERKSLEEISEWK